MNRLGVLFIGFTIATGVSTVWAHSEHEHDHESSVQEASAPTTSGSQDQILAGEVVDVFCYLSHGKEGTGKGHAGCAKKCIQQGLPVAIKVGDQLYLATMASHEPANKTLAELAGQHVTVHGKVMEQDGQHLIAITHVEKSD